MKYTVQINSIKSVDQIDDYWTLNDYKMLLQICDYTDTESGTLEELRDLLFMALTDNEPDEAAAIVLEYKLSDELSEGQIEQISHEMVDDKIAEEYADIALQEDLFHINQLLYKAFNGTFPCTYASVVDFTLGRKDSKPYEISKELILSAFNGGFSDRSVIKRLFDDQLDGRQEFPEAEHIIWDLYHLDGNNYQIITSKYWMDADDFVSEGFDCDVHLFVEETED